MADPAPSLPNKTAMPVPGRRHPAGLKTLFFTEMWERFSYYGMRALLVLFMVAAVQDGGLGMTDEKATAIYGLYTAAVYLACLPGGWAADRLLGARRAVWMGGIIIALGHFLLAVPSIQTFYLGLIFVVAGTGLLKPNVSALVGSLYAPGDKARDAGFTIFYMGINVGAFLGPLACGYLAEKVSWHYGFGAAGIGMVIGLIQFRLTAPLLGGVGEKSDAVLSSLERKTLGGGLALAGIVLVLAFGGVLPLNALAMARGATVFIVSVAVVYFAWVLLFGGLDGGEKRRIWVIIVLFIGSALFWAGFEQAGSSFNLFAERYTDRVMESLDFEIPATWFQSLGPLFIIALAPVMAWLWIYLARRQLDPSLPAKFGAGLIFLALGFVVMAAAAKRVAAGNEVWPTWLIATYLIHTIGELCLSPVGLSSVTKLSPARLVGQMMGTWFLASSLGNLIAGLLAGRFDSEAVEEMPRQYLEIGILPFVVGVALLVLARPIQKLAGSADSRG